MNTKTCNANCGGIHAAHVPPAPAPRFVSDAEAASLEEWMKRYAHTKTMQGQEYTYRGLLDTRAALLEAIEESMGPIIREEQYQRNCERRVKELRALASRIRKGEK